MKIIIFKEQGYSETNICAGELVAKKKTYKVKPIKSGHFRSYRTLITECDVIAVVDAGREKDVLAVFNEIANVDAINKFYSDEIKKLKEKRNAEIDNVILKINKYTEIENG